jgi:hypothetical protein
MNRNDIIKMFAYMLTSARGCVDEPKIYGPLRLADSVCRLYYLLKENNLIDDVSIDSIIKKIDEKKSSCMTDEQEFINMLDEVIDDLVTIMK